MVKGWNVGIAAIRGAVMTQEPMWIEPEPHTLGKELRRLRAERGWSQHELTRRLGLRPGQQHNIPRWELDKQQPQGEMLERLEQVYEREPGALRLLASHTEDYLRAKREGRVPTITEPGYFIADEPGTREVLTEVLTLTDADKVTLAEAARQLRHVEPVCGEPNFWEAVAALAKVEGQVDPAHISPQEWAVVDRMWQRISAKRETVATPGASRKREPSP